MVSVTLHVQSRPLLTLTVRAGNFHALLLFKTDAELAVARELVHRMVERAIKLDGTCEPIVFPLPV